MPGRDYGGDVSRQAQHPIAKRFNSYGGSTSENRTPVWQQDIFLGFLGLLGWCDFIRRVFIGAVKQAAKLSSAI